MANAERRLEELLRKLEPDVRKAFEDAIRKARRAVNIAALTDALDRGDLQRAVELLRIDTQILLPLSESVRSAYMAGGEAVGELIPAILEARFGFGSNPRAEAQVSRITGQLIQGIQLDSLAMTREVIAAGVNEGIPPAKLARQMTGFGRERTGGYLGLTKQQAADVQRARAMLSDPDRVGEYFIKDRETGKLKPRFKLTNRQHDAIVRKAIAEGRALTAAELERVQSGHRSKALGYRGRVIAQDQARKALRAGQHEGFVQLAETLPADRYIEVGWLVTRDGRQRDSHDALGGMKVRLGEVFVSPVTGAQMEFPGDDSHGAPASDVILCRCGATYRIVRRT